METTKFIDIEKYTIIKKIGKGSFGKVYIIQEKETEQILPSSIVTIENGAFYGCTKLTEISIPSSVISIGEETFCTCRSLANIIISSPVSSIEKKCIFIL